MRADNHQGAETNGRLPPRFGIDVREDHDEVVLRISGELDLATARKFRQALYAQVATHQIVELDLRGLDFLDSSGLQLLMTAFKSAKADGWTLRIVPPEGRARRALSVAGLERVLPLV